MIFNIVIPSPSYRISSSEDTYLKVFSAHFKVCLSQWSVEVGRTAILIPILEIRTLSFREAKGLTLGHVTSKWQK